MFAVFSRQNWKEFGLAPGNIQGYFPHLHGEKTNEATREGCIYEGGKTTKGKK